MGYHDYVTMFRGETFEIENSLETGTTSVCNKLPPNNKLLPNNNVPDSLTMSPFYVIGSITSFIGSRFLPKLAIAVIGGCIGYYIATKTE